MNKTPSQPRRFIVGFFEVEGFGPDAVEAEVTGNGQRDYAALKSLICQKHPATDPGGIKRVGSVIEIRDDSNPGWITVAPGLTLRQLFDPESVNDQPLSSRDIGTIFFAGTPCRVLLTFNRGKGCCGVTLLPRIKIGDSTINFSNQINAQQLVETLPGILAGVLGTDARNPVLKFKPATK